MWPLLLFLFASGLLPATGNAQKTDTLWVQNGGVVIGEIKDLDRGQLRYKTDAFSTVYADWEKVLSIQSDKYFELTLATGARKFGRLARGPEDRTATLLPDSTVVSLTEIVEIVPIRQSFWSRMDGYVDLGFNIFRANNSRNLNAATKVAYQGERWAADLSASSYYQRQDSANDVRRDNVSLTAKRLFANRWDAVTFLSWERNDEVQLDHRFQAGVGGAYRLVHTHRHRVTLLAAGAYSTEKYSTSPDDTNSFELVGSAGYQAYRLSTPKLDVSSSLTTYASMTDLGRIRLSFDGRVAYEIIKDFTVGVRAWDDFDSRSPGTDSTSNDYGLTFSLGYSF